MKKILLCNEASFLSSGYAVYGRQLLLRLNENPNYEVAEFACYAHGNDERLSGIPWKVYSNLPNEGENEAYSSDPMNKFGKWRFEQVCLDFKPDVVLSFRDYWMDSFIAESPYRRYFKHVWMPTCDAYPQREEWVSVYSTADALLTYTDWSGEVLKHQSGGKINWIGSASPAASDTFRPLDNRNEIRNNFGIKDDDFVIGTVMRNQRRKLYPHLFEHFREFLDETGMDNVYLYCHTSYPDRGWDIPYLIKQSGISSKVLFTYSCRNCKTAFPSKFKDVGIACPRCGAMAAGMSSVQGGVDDEKLNMVYNLFDMYVQYANSEGFGMPQTEAAAVGLPIASIDYSAMSDVLTRLNGYRIKAICHDYELETGCRRAIPDKESFKQIINDYINLPQSMKDAKKDETRYNFKSYYSWDKVADMWSKGIDSCGDSNWDADIDIFQSVDYEEFPRMSHVQYTEWLINNVLGRPDLLGSFMQTELIKNINYGVKKRSVGGMYFNEQSSMFFEPKFDEYSRRHAYEEMLNLRNRLNFWEDKRA